MMEFAFLRNATNNQLLQQQPFQFVRIPVAGESIQIGNGVWNVAAVFHGWQAQNEPVVVLQVTPPGWHAGITNGH
jgi:hypothetical protein